MICTLLSWHSKSPIIYLNLRCLQFGHQLTTYLRILYPSQTLYLFRPLTLLCFLSVTHTSASFPWPWTLWGHPRLLHLQFSQAKRCAVLMEVCKDLLLSDEDDVRTQHTSLYCASLYCASVTAFFTNSRQDPPQAKDYYALYCNTCFIALI